jgi:hypothetical protein
VDVRAPRASRPCGPRGAAGPALLAGAGLGRDQVRGPHRGDAGSLRGAHRAVGGLRATRDPLVGGGPDARHRRLHLGPAALHAAGLGRPLPGGAGHLRQLHRLRRVRPRLRPARSPRVPCAAPGGPLDPAARPHRAAPARAWVRPLRAVGSRAGRDECLPGQPPRALARGGGARGARGSGPRPARDRGGAQCARLLHRSPGAPSRRRDRDPASAGPRPPLAASAHRPGAGPRRARARVLVPRPPRPPRRPSRSRRARPFRAASGSRAGGGRPVRSDGDAERGRHRALRHRRARALGELHPRARGPRGPLRTGDAHLHLPSPGSPAARGRAHPSPTALPHFRAYRSSATEAGHEARPTEPAACLAR